MADDAGQLTAAVEAAKQNLAGLEGILKTTSSEYNKLKEEMTKIQDAESNLLEELGKAQKELTKSKAEVKTWQEKAAFLRQEYASKLKGLMDLKRATMVAALSANKSKPSPEANSETSIEINIDQIIGDSNGDGDCGELPIYTLEELNDHTTETLTRNISALEAEREKLDLIPPIHGFSSFKQFFLLQDEIKCEYDSIGELHKEGYRLQVLTSLILRC